MLPKLICYHPIRYDYYLKELLNFVIDAYNSADPEEKEKYRGLLFGMYFQKEVDEMLKYEPKAIPAHLSKEQWIEYKSELFYANANIYDEGENIFHLQYDLLKLFQRTDVSEIQIEQLMSPYSSFYLYFGDSKEFKLDNGKYIDGAYVEHDSNEEAISLHLTSRDESLDALSIKASELDYLLTEDHLYCLLLGDWGGRKQ